MRTNWIFACGMRRSGSTLQYHLAREIVKLNDGVDIGWTTWQEFDDKFKEVDGKYPYAIVKSHVFLPLHSREVTVKTWKGNSRFKGVSTYRPTKDIYASLKRTFPHSDLEKDIYVTWFQEALRWFVLPRVMWTRYTSLLDYGGLVNECRRIMNFTKMNLSEEQAEKIAEDHMLDRQRERMTDKSKLKPRNHGMYNYDYWMWDNHISSVENGAWQSELSESEIAFCDRIETQLPEGFRDN